jgi:hypothetical protein
MPHWPLSLPPPAVPTSPSRLHHSSSPIAVDSPLRHPLMLSCSCAIHCHPLPSIAIHCHPSPSIAIHCRAVHHRQVAIAPSFAVHHHCNHSPLPSRSHCPIPSIAVKEPSHHPSPLRSRRAVHHHQGAIHCCQSIHCFQIAVAPSIAVHRR